jgi:hypothetical protein
MNNMTEKEQLLPCPFCGGDNVTIEETKNDDIYRVDHYCGRLDHFIRFKMLGHQEAIDAWNTRANQWILLEDRLPNEGQQVICADNLGDVGIGIFYWEDKDEWISTTKYWMPYPELPNGSANNNLAISADEKEQLRRLKAFVNELFTDGGEMDYYSVDDIRDDAIHYNLLEVESEKSFLYKKADWLKDKNEKVED